ncbi:small secreted protein [Streptomyces sp. NPDC050504]|uniref:small secreted protein n=1 Tax=Streptomyces sp. NPDC050504 TaxID=3365618 RepID=UPI0037AEBB11
MNKKLAAALSSGAVLVLALTGCSDDGDDGKKVDDWAGKFCGQAQPQLQKIADANAAIKQQTDDNSKPAEVQKTDSAAFQQMSDAYKALGAAVQDAGAPPVDSGEKTQKEAVAELNASSVAYANLKKKVDALDATDQAKFAQGLKGVAIELGKIGDNSDAALKKLEAGEVGKAMGKQPGCQKKTPSLPPENSAPAASQKPSAPAKPATKPSDGASAKETE